MHVRGGSSESGRGAPQRSGVANWRLAVLLAGLASCSGCTHFLIPDEVPDVEFEQIPRLGPAAIRLDPSPPSAQSTHVVTTQEGEAALALLGIVAGGPGFGRGATVRHYAPNDRWTGILTWELAEELLLRSVDVHGAAPFRVLVRAEGVGGTTSGGRVRVDLRVTVRLPDGSPLVQETASGWGDSADSAAVQALWEAKVRVLSSRRFLEALWHPPVGAKPPLRTDARAYDGILRHRIGRAIRRLDQRLDLAARQGLYTDAWGRPLEERRLTLLRLLQDHEKRARPEADPRSPATDLLPPVPRRPVVPSPAPDPPAERPSARKGP